jgi:hypothetical protein
LRKEEGKEHTLLKILGSAVSSWQYPVRAPT